MIVTVQIIINKEPNKKVIVKIINKVGKEDVVEEEEDIAETSSNKRFSSES